MKSNNDIVDDFYSKKLSNNRNLTSTGNKLISYNTTIAERIVINDVEHIIKNITKYSSSTFKHQRLVNKYDYITTKDVPKNTANLKKYI